MVEQSRAAGQRRVVDLGQTRARQPRRHRRQHYLAGREPWTWFRRAVRVRKEREFDPVIDGLNAAAGEAQRTAQSEGDEDLRLEAERLAYLLKFVRMFFGGIETFLQIDPSALQ